MSAFEAGASASLCCAKLMEAKSRQASRTRAGRFMSHLQGSEEWYRRACSDATGTYPRSYAASALDWQLVCRKNRPGTPYVRGLLASNLAAKSFSGIRGATFAP